MDPDPNLLKRFKESISYRSLITSSTGTENVSGLHLSWLGGLNSKRSDRSLLIEKGETRIVLANLLTLDDQEILIREKKCPVTAASSSIFQQSVMEGRFPETHSGQNNSLKPVSIPIRIRAPRHGRMPRSLSLWKNRNL